MSLDAPELKLGEITRKNKRVRVYAKECGKGAWGAREDNEQREQHSSRGKELADKTARVSNVP